MTYYIDCDCENLHLLEFFDILEDAQDAFEELEGCQNKILYSVDDDGKFTKIIEINHD